jgi:hypothetical protein
VTVRRAAAIGVLVVAATAAVDVLGDLTQTRPDRPLARSSTEVVYQVILRDEGSQSVAKAAQGLWGACQGTIERATSPSDVRLTGPVAQVVVHPALGAHAKRRLEGCLEDATLDRVRGDVIAMRVRSS